MSTEPDEPPKVDNLIFGEIQVLLAEKRTALASLRTGIAVFALPLSVLSVLDVRTQAEWKKNQYEDALHVPRPALSQDLDGLPNNRTIGVICGSGYRSSIAASLLLARGFPSLQKRDGRHGSLRKNEVPADGVGRPCLRVVIRSNFSERAGRDKL